MVPEPHDGLCGLGWGRGGTLACFPEQLRLAADELPALVDVTWGPSSVRRAGWLPVPGRWGIAERAARLSQAAERGQWRLCQGLAIALRNEAYRWCDEEAAGRVSAPERMVTMIESRRLK